MFNQTYSSDLYSDSRVLTLEIKRNILDLLYKYDELRHPKSLRKPFKMNRFPQHSGPSSVETKIQFSFPIFLYSCESMLTFTS